MKEKTELEKLQELEELKKVRCELFTNPDLEITPELEAEKMNLISNPALLKLIEHDTIAFFDLKEGKCDFYSSTNERWLHAVPRIVDEDINSPSLAEITFADDLPYAYKLENNVFNFLMSLQPSEVPSFGLNYFRRLKNKKEGYVCTRFRYKVVLCDVNGKPWIIMGLIKLFAHLHCPDMAQYRFYSVFPAKQFKKWEKIKGATFLHLNEEPRKVFTYYNAGYSKEEIADKLFKSDKTVKAHNSNTLSMFDLKKTILTCRVAEQLQLIKEDDVIL